MRFIDYIFMAFKNIQRQKLRSALTIFAIVIGATSVTIMLALVTGMKDFFYSQFESSGALQQVIVTSQADLNFDEAHWGGGACNDCIKLTDAMANQIKTYEHVEAVARTTKPYVFDSLTFAGKKYRVENVSAEDPGVVKHVFVAGKEFAANDGAGKIIIGQEYADKMGFKGKYDSLVGKKLTLATQGYFSGEGATLPDPVAQFLRCQAGNGEKGACDNKNDQNPPTYIDATITGVTSDDPRLLLFPMKWALGLMEDRRYEMSSADQKAYDEAQQACQNRYKSSSKWGDNGPPEQCRQIVPHFTLTVTSRIQQEGYQSLIVKVDKSSNTGAVATKIRKLQVGAVTADDYIKEQLSMFKVISLVLGGIGGIALAVAAIGVINTMVMSVLERTHEIGVMRAVGARRSTVSRLFTFEAALLGFFGGVFGVTVGYGLTRLANIVINKQLTSNSVAANNIIGLPLWLWVSIISATTVIGILAGLYPAHRAAKLDPVEALRYE